MFSSLREAMSLYRELEQRIGVAGAAKVLNPQLALVGCAIQPRSTGGAWLALAEEHPEVDQLFANSPWEDGSWRSVLRTAPDNLRSEGEVAISGAEFHCLLFSVDALP